MKLLKTLTFDGHAIRAQRENSGKNWWLYVLLAAALLAVPLTADEIGSTPVIFVQYIAFLLVFIIASYLLSKLFGGTSSFETFVHPMAAIMAVTAGFVLVLALVSLFLFERTFDVPVVSNIITSFLPFYMVALWAFSAEVLSLVKKGAVVYGSLSVIVLAVLFFFV